jgi:hypothetical protein
MEKTGKIYATAKAYITGKPTLMMVTSTKQKGRLSGRHIVL